MVIQWDPRHTHCYKSSGPRETRDSLHSIVSSPEAPALVPLLFSRVTPAPGWRAGVVDNHRLVASQEYPWALGFFPTEERPQPTHPTSPKTPSLKSAVF